MWAYFCWLQISWVCRWILKTMSSCPGLTPMLHSTIGLTAGSSERARGGHPHFKEKTFSKSVNTFDNNHMRCLFFMMTSTHPKMDWCNTLYSNYGHNVTFNFDYTLSRFNDYFATYEVNRSRSNGFFTWRLSNMRWGYMANPWKRTLNIYCLYMLGTNRAVPKS